VTHEVVRSPRVLETVPARPDASVVLDVAAGLVGESLSMGMSVLRSVAGSPVLRSRALWRPALLPTRLQPATLVNEVARRGARHRVMAVRQVQALIDEWTPVLSQHLLARVDLDAAVSQVDIDAIAGRLDIEGVIARIDLVAIVEEVIAAIDLPAIIRDSTGSMASETVRGARMTGITVDEAISRALERHVFRGRRAQRAEGD
jgi:hypothetical protein